jgi:hypothetical protein
VDGKKSDNTSWSAGEFRTTTYPDENSDGYGGESSEMAGDPRPKPVKKRRGVRSKLDLVKVTMMAM